MLLCLAFPSGAFVTLVVEVSPKKSLPIAAPPYQPSFGIKDLAVVWRQIFEE
jgi:hypothetical protein